MVVRSVVLTIVAAACGFGWQEPVKPDSQDVSLTPLVPVSVTDVLGRAVQRLAPEVFHVYENGIRQQSSLIDNNLPLSVGLIVDTSSSMSGRFESTHDAMRRFLDSIATNPQNEAFLIEFGDNASVIEHFTHDLKAIPNRLTSGNFGGKTALLDAVNLGLNEMANAVNRRRALLILTDGHDTNSHHTQSEVKNALVHSSVQLYGIVVLAEESRFSRTNDLDLLKSLVDPTGGKIFGVQATGAPEAAGSIAFDLTTQYLVTWRSTNRAHDGKFRKISIMLTSSPRVKSVTMNAPGGYYAPN